jgi:hypothetical protein
MSFADFLRFHWDVRDWGDDAAEDAGALRAPIRDGAGEVPEAAHPVAADLPPVDVPMDRADAAADAGQEDVIAEDETSSDEDDEGDLGDEAQLEANAELGGGDADEDDGDAMDMELHVAVDELLGVRGPIHVLLRNLLWLLAFNAAYLGLFAFVPFSIGTSVLSAMRHYVHLGASTDTSPEAWEQPGLIRNMVVVLAEISKTAADEGHTLQLPDLGTIALGYLVISLIIFTWRSIIRWRFKLCV